MWPRIDLHDPRQESSQGSKNGGLWSRITQQNLKYLQSLYNV